MHRVSVPVRVKPLLQDIGELAAQYGMSAYAVGGCVRDWVFGIDNTTDLDITVEGRGIDVAQAAASALGGTLEVHQQFGTATLRLKRRTKPTARLLSIDFATCRRETYASPGAYPRVTPGTLHEDLLRRDFTINAMAMALAPGRFGELIDPFEGARDLRRKQLQILYARSFFDDPSRILRGVRFAQRFGFHWEHQTERAAREAVAAGALSWLNAGRLQKELDRMLEEPKPRRCFERLAALLEQTVA